MPVKSPEVGGVTASGAVTATRGQRPGKPGLQRAPGRLRLWVLQRGVLYGLTQAPMIALMVGFIFKWTSYPLATTFIVLPTMVLLPVWILTGAVSAQTPRLFQDR